MENEEWRVTTEACNKKEQEHQHKHKHTFEVSI